MTNNKKFDELSKYVFLEWKLENNLKDKLPENFNLEQLQQLISECMHTSYLAAQKEAEGLKIRLENIAELIERPISMTDACSQLGNIEKLAREALKKYSEGE